MNKLKRLFSLYLVFFKTDDADNKIILQEEINLLHKEIEKDEDVSEDTKEIFNKILKQYKTIYESDDIIEKYKAEDKVRELIQSSKQ
jgi:inorganic pyrophosphatase